MNIRFLLGCALSLTCSYAFAADTPNIVYILCDDIGYGDLGCYGAKMVKTPNIDRLASQGRQFSDAHSPASVCTPTRYALLTGRYAWRAKGTGIAPGDSPALITPGTTTVASLLKSAGYHTAVIGKWHLGLGDPPKTDFNRALKPGPLEIGFDEAFLIPATGDRVPCVLVENHTIVGYDPTDPIQISYDHPIGNEPTGVSPEAKLKMKADPQHSGTVVNGISRIGWMTGGHAAHWVDEDIPETLTRKALAFIEKNRAAPFFLYLATHDIHEPMVPNQRFKGTSNCGSRGDVIQQLDWQVGEVLAALDRLQLSDRTLVIFTSDNGGAIKDTYDDGTNQLHSKQPPNGTLKGQKGTLFEGGHRVPFIIRWPGHIPAGSTSDALIAHIDTLATVAALTHIPLPANAGPDSVNVLPELLGQPQSQPSRTNLVLQNNRAEILALRDGDWVLIEKTSGGKIKPDLAVPTDPVETSTENVRYELYDLARDLAQERNLADEEPTRVQAMAQHLAKIRAEQK